MAEIKIEKKKTNWLPLLLGLLALLLAGWFVIEAFDDDYEIETSVDTTEEAMIMDSDNETYVAVDNTDQDDDRYNTSEAYQTRNASALSDSDNVDTYRDGNYEKDDFDSSYALLTEKIAGIDQEMNLEHDYCYAAFSALNNSLRALANDYGMSDEANLKSTTDKIEMHVKAITDNWKETDHANHIRKAALISVEAIETIQKAKFPAYADAIDELYSEAKSIDTNTLTLNQKQVVKSFFEEAAEVLAKMRKS